MTRRCETEFEYFARLHREDGRVRMQNRQIARKELVAQGIIDPVEQNQLIWLKDAVFPRWDAKEMARS